MAKSKGVKYSSYLDDLDQLRLEKFCEDFNCSKAKAISYLLELWENGTINNKLTLVRDDMKLELEKKIDHLIGDKLEAKLAPITKEIEKIKRKI